MGVIVISYGAPQKPCTPGASLHCDDPVHVLNPYTGKVDVA